MSEMLRIVTVTNMEQYQTDPWVLEYVPYTEYYVADCLSLDSWKTLRPIPHTRTWCPLNSFNLLGRFHTSNWDQLENDVRNGMIHRQCPHHIYLCCLQGAGDLVMLSTFARHLQETFPDAPIRVGTYSKFAEIPQACPMVDSVEPYTVGQPTDLKYSSLRAEAKGRAYFFHYPRALRPLVLGAIESGWSKYEFAELLFGMKIPDREPQIEMKEEIPEPIGKIFLSSANGRPLVGLHWHASSPDRSYPQILDIVARFPHVHFVLFGCGWKSTDDPRGSNITNLCGRCSYAESLAAFRQLDCAVVVDSIMLHLAKLTTTPTLALFGWSPASWSGPYPENITCTEAKGMQSIRQEQVEDWLEEKLKL